MSCTGTWSIAFGHHCFNVARDHSPLLVSFRAAHTPDMCCETCAADPLCTGAVYLSESSSANSSDKLSMPRPGGHVTAGGLSTCGRAGNFLLTWSQLFSGGYHSLLLLTVFSVLVTQRRHYARNRCDDFWEACVCVRIRRRSHSSSQWFWCSSVACQT